MTVWFATTRTRDRDNKDAIRETIDDDKSVESRLENELDGRRDATSRSLVTERDPLHHLWPLQLR